MSANLEDTAQIEQLEDVKNFLFTDQVEPTSWLDSVKYSLSNTGETLSFLYQNKIVITKVRESVGDVSPSYHVIYKGMVADLETDVAVSFISLSVAYQQKSVGVTTVIKTGTWNCVAVGFSSGYLRIYTESGEQMFEQIFHPKPILSMKYCHPKVLQDELLIIYDDILISLDGFSLYQCLRICRIQLQRTTTTAKSAAKNLTISFKKWQLKDQASTSDVEFFGVKNTSPFEHLFQASLAGGSSHYVGQAGLGPVYNYVAVGKGPIIAQYCPSETTAQPIMSEVVLGVASKLMSYIPGSSWLSGWSQTEDTMKFESPIAISKNLSIEDPRREICSIKAAPKGQLAILSDSFGRLLLLDVTSMLVVNIWKGYRDAQCGWALVPNLDSSEDSYETFQETLYLVIYAKKRGILEIWCPYQHYRVAAYNLGKKCILISSTFSALGEGSLTSPLIIPEWRGAKSSCYLIQDSGKVINISIPFECCLGAEYLLSIEDSKFLQSVKSVFAKETFSSEDEQMIAGTVSSLKLAASIDPIIKIICCHPKLSLDLKLDLCDNLKNEISQSKELFTHPDFVEVFHFCSLFTKISMLHSTLANRWKSVSFPKNTEKSVCLSDIYSDVDDFFSKCHEDISNSVPNLAIFTTSFRQISRSASIDGSTQISFEPKQENRSEVTRFLTLLLIFCEDYPEIFGDLTDIGIPQSDIFALFIESCLTLDSKITTSEYQTKISSVVKYCITEHDSPLSLWETFFSLVKSHPGVCQGLVLVIYCQQLAVDTLKFENRVLEPEEKNEEGSGGEEQEWVALSPEHEQWYTARQQLSDTLHLQINTGVACTVQQLLHSNTQSVTHIVANQLIDRGIVRNFVEWVERCRNPRETQEEGNKEDERTSPDEEMYDDSLTWLLNIVPWWPYQLDPTAISVCLVECLIFRWSEVLDTTAPEVDLLYLRYAATVLLGLGSAAVQQHLLNILWETVFHSRIRRIYYLIEKIGRQPKDRMCVKDLSLNLTSTVEFVSIARHILVNVNISPDKFDGGLMSKEENVWSSEKRSWLLHKVASGETQVNPTFVLLHAQLITSLELIIALNVKNIRPSILFHSKFSSLFFSPLTSPGNLKLSTTPDIDTLHEQMLKNCVKAAVSGELEFTSPYRSTWSNLVLNLASLWDIVVPIQSYMVVFLYSLGKFEEADEIVMTSSNRQLLGVQLLEVLVALIENQIFLDEASQKEFLPLLSPTLSSWLRSKRDPNVAMLDIRLLFKTICKVLTWVAGDDVVIRNCRELRACLGEALW